MDCPTRMADSRVRRTLNMFATLYRWKCKLEPYRIFGPDGPLAADLDAIRFCSEQNFFSDMIWCMHVWRHVKSAFPSEGTSAQTRYTSGRLLRTSCTSRRSHYVRLLVEHRETTGCSFGSLSHVWRPKAEENLKKDTISWEKIEKMLIFFNYCQTMRPRKCLQCSGFWG